MDHCEIPRWQDLKNSLSNLSYNAFVDQLISDHNGVCIDVRTAEEFKQGSLRGAININYLSQNLADRLEELDPNKSYYVYCRTGRRSLRVCVILNNLGCKKVYNMIDGISKKP